jgi:hypothetical protein
MATPEISAALQPFTSILAELMDQDNTVDPHNCPAKLYMKKSSKTPLEHLWSMVATGNIAATDICKVQSWYFNNIPGAQDDKTGSWVGSTAIAHACTLLLAHRIQDDVINDPSCPPESDQLGRYQFVVKAAWDLLQNEDPLDGIYEVSHVDVALEEVKRLEEAMFGEGSIREWGRDLGVSPHQDGWDPYTTYAGSDPKKRKVRLFLSRIYLTSV